MSQLTEFEKDNATMKEPMSMSSMGMSVSRATKRLTVTLMVLCAMVVCIAAFGATSASAAVSLAVSVDHAPTVVNRGDDYFAYTVSVRNSGDTVTTVPTNVNLSLPAGVQFDGLASGTGWTCVLAATTCSYSNSPAVAAGANFPLLTVAINVDKELAPDTLTTNVTVFGGGATGGSVGQHSFDLGPELAFGLLPGSFVAGACDAPPVLLPPTTGACEAGSLGDPSTQAGGHPFAVNGSFDVVLKKVKPTSNNGGVQVFEDVRDGVVNLPPGFVANPTVISGGCTVDQVKLGICPARFAVGRSGVQLDGYYNPDGSRMDDQSENSVVYKIKPEKGYPAAFAFRPETVSSYTVTLRPKLRPGDSTVSALLPSPPMSPALHGVKYFVFCSFGVDVEIVGGLPLAHDCKSSSDPSAFSRPFVTNPPRCSGVPDVTSIDLASYRHPGEVDGDDFPVLSDPDWKSYEAESPALTGCDQLEFDPSFEARPSTDVADRPSGLGFKLDVPQGGLVDPEGLATPHLKHATVVLPEGLAVNPSAANGLEACSTEQMGLLELDHPGLFPIRFDGEPVGCPNGSKIGNVEVTSPLVDETVYGGVYLAEQDDPATSEPGAENPFDSLLALYIAVRNETLGVSVKLAGKVTPDPETGQLTATFDQNPQLPFDHLKLTTFDGDRATLRTPAICGSFGTDATFVPWSAPESGPPAEPEDSFDVSSSPNAACVTDPALLPNTPALTAGTLDRKGGSYSPFVVDLRRGEASQEVKAVDVVLPRGLTGRLADIPYCPQAGIDQAIARDDVGEGADEQADPSCPTASRIGTVAAAAGAGPDPFRAPGIAYLAGPYKGAPLSLVVVAPAVAGPFDLGTVVVRNAMFVDRRTARVTVKSDPIPTILHGIPIDLRSIEVSADRDPFTLNPTSCTERETAATTFGTSPSTPVVERFQASDCAALPFKPRLALRLTGRRQVTTGKHPGIRAQVNQTGVGEAGIEKAVVRLPKSLALDPDNAQALCEFEAGTKDDLEKHCPKGSIVGRARATSPLLNDPLVGNVYFVKNIRTDAKTGNQIRTLPMIIVALRGQIAINLYGESDTTKFGKLVSTFNNVPDAPITQFNLNINGGPKGIIAVTRTRRSLINICTGRHTAEADMNGHNGRRHDRDIRMKTPCTKKQTKAAKRQAKRAAAKARAGSKRG